MIHAYTTQPIIGVHTDVTGKGAIQADGLQFRDASGDGALQPYEDWRLFESCRAKDLVARMSVAEIIGLFISSSSIGQVSQDGVITERDVNSIVELHRRQALVRTGNLNSVVVVATYFNNTQELAEAQPLGIPILFLDDPSHSMSARLWSNWPGTLGLGAINNLNVTWAYGDTVRREYMSIGMRMQYGPMADLATEPRWARVSGTFGENAHAVARHIAAAVVGFQGSATGDVRNGIIATMTHFPGHGPDIDGLDAHNYEGRWIVFPGDNFMYHTIPFQAAIDVGVRAMMPSYGIYLGQTDWDPDQVSAGFSYGLMTNLAKEHMGFTGLVTADWGILGTSRGWGMESLSLPERVRMFFEAGSHQFGSESDAPIWEAYDSGLITDPQIETAAAKILENFFMLGLFENPYVDAAAADTIARSVQNRRMGFEAQKLAIVILANREHLGGGSSAPRYLPIDGARYQDENFNGAPDVGEYTCDTNDDGVVSVYYDGITDGLVGSDALDDFLDTYDYTSAGSGTTLPIVAVASLSEADIAVIRINSLQDLDFDGDDQTKKIIDAFRVRDGYVDADLNPIEATNLSLKIVLVERMNNATIVQPFINGLISLDETVGEYGSYPTIHEENIQIGGRGVDGFLVDFGAFDRAVLDVLFNVNVPDGSGFPAPSEAGWAYGMARLPIEILSSLAEVEAQFEDLPNDTLNPTFRIGAGVGY
jgi:beta-glucosidase